MDPVLDIDTVTLGLRVCRRQEHWRNGKWRDDRRLPGTVIGYTDANGELQSTATPSTTLTESPTPVGQAGPWLNGTLLESIVSTPLVRVTSLVTGGRLGVGGRATRYSCVLTRVMS